MASFYGNIKNNSRASFIFDRIYPSRCAMEDALAVTLDSNNEVRGDGVFINRYVLINYGYEPAGDIVTINPSYVQASGETANSSHIVTANNYTTFLTYDENTRQYQPATVYYTRSQLNQGKRYYKRNVFNDRYYLNNQSGRVENSYYQNNRQLDSTRYHADYHLTVWMKIYTDDLERYIQVGRLKAEAPAFELLQSAPAEGSSDNVQRAPHFDLLRSSDINYVYYTPKHWDIVLGTTNYNANGFSPTTRYRSSTADSITLPATASGTKYPVFVGQAIELTPDTYVPNQYYTNSACTALATGNFNASTTYYIRTQQYSNGAYVTASQNDRKSLTITLPSIGNSVSDLYDALYGRANTSNDSSSTRPFTQSQLFNYENIEPYNNITGSDKISATWGIIQLKQYISELRFLSNGQVNSESSLPEAGKGLQTDWTLDNKDSFGYIYHKPRVLWSNSSSPDSTTTDTNYLAAHTIEYIYDHYTSANTTLFGPNRNQASWLNARY